MAAMLLAKRGTTIIYKASSLVREYNNSARSLAYGVHIITSSRYFSSNGNKGREKSKQEGMGTTTDGKAPNVTLSHAADGAKDGLKQALDVAIEESGDARKPKGVENDEESEENVSVGKKGTVKGQNQSSG